MPITPGPLGCGIIIDFVTIMAIESFRQHPAPQRESRKDLSTVRRHYQEMTEDVGSRYFQFVERIVGCHAGELLEEIIERERRRWITIPEARGKHDYRIFRILWGTPDLRPSLSERGISQDCNIMMGNNQSFFEIVPSRPGVSFVCFIGWSHAQNVNQSQGLDALQKIGWHSLGYWA